MSRTFPRTACHALGLLSCLALLGAPATGAARADDRDSPPPAPTATPGARKTGGGAAEASAGGTGHPASLADIARQSRAENEAAGKPPRRLVITNESLRKDGEPGAAPSPSTPSASPSGKPARSRAARKTPAPEIIAIPEYKDSLGRTESDWRAIAQAARKRVEDAEEAKERLSNEVRRLENDFYAWDDGNYRDRVIRPAWEQAKEALKKNLEELDAAKAALEDLQEQARKAGTPPGWLR